MSNATQAQRVSRPVAAAKPAKPQGELRRVSGTLNRFLSGNRSSFFMAMLMLLAESGTSIAAKFPLAWLVDYLTSGRRPEILLSLGFGTLFSTLPTTLVFVSSAIIVLALLNSITDSLSELYLAKGGRRLGFNLRAALYGHLQKLSLAFYSRQRTGDLLTRVTSDVTAVENFAIDSLKDIAASIFLLVLSLIALFSSSWQVAVVAVVMIPILSIVSNFFADRIKNGAKKLRSREGDLAASTQEMLTSIRVIQTYGSGGDQLRRFSDLSQQTMDTALRVARLQAWFSSVFNVLQAVTLVLVVLVGVWLISQGIYPVGTLLIFTGIIADMFKPTKRIIKQWNEVGKIIASVERIGEVLDRQPAVQNEPGAVEAPAFTGDIEYRNVSFAYQVDPEDDPKGEAQLRLALRNVDLRIARGEVVALVGGSGAGKSTIVQLLPRLYDPHAGQVLIDGHDIRGFTLDSLRSRMSMVLQETILFAGTVAENISYGRPDATREEIIAAAIEANAHDFIQQLPEGYDTVLSERAANLSGGQRQRLAIARAFIRNTPILILDEPTTGLDAESTELVLLALRTLMKGRSTLIISHDLNLIRSADRIVVVKQGAIEQVGSHRELLAAGGLYADLYHKQFGQAVEEQTGRQGPSPAPPAPPDDDTEPEPLAPEVFQTLMSSALPQPVPPKMFETLLLRLDGAPTPPPPLAAPRPPTAPAALLDATQLDPVSSPVLREELPGIEGAFDERRMRDYLQAALFGSARPGYQIEACEVEEAAYPIDNGCVVRYQLVVRDAGSGRVFSPLVSGRLFPSALDAALYMRDHLAPLTALARGREDLAPFASPAALVEPLRMVVHAFPLDGQLPSLVGATDRRRMAEVLGEVLSASSGAETVVDSCDVELVDYARKHRCTLRYTLRTRSNGDGGERQLVYGKVFATGEGALAGVVTKALRERAASGAFQFRVPQVLAWRRDLHLSLLEAIPGESLIGDLLKARLRDKPAPPSTLSLEEMIESCGRVAAALHSSSIRLGRRRGLDDELGALRGELAPILRVSPGLGARLQRHLEYIERYAEQSDALPLRFCHGDFTHGQLIFDGTATGLIDFDSICQAEPALDLGQFLVYLRAAGRKADSAFAAPMLERLSERFMAAYLADVGDAFGDHDRLRVRVAIYKTVSLLRRTLRSWQKIEGARVRNAVETLEEELACLPQLKY